MDDFHEIASEFSFVFNKGFVMNSLDYKPQEFGNAIMKLKGEKFSIFLKRDRGQIFVDIGNDDIGWYGLNDVLEFIDHAVAHHSEKTMNIAYLAKSLQDKWEEVTGLFCDKGDISKLEEFARLKNTQLINKIFANK